MEDVGSPVSFLLLSPVEEENQLARRRVGIELLRHGSGRLEMLRRDLQKGDEWEISGHRFLSDSVRGPGKQPCSYRKYRVHFRHERH